MGKKKYLKNLESTRVKHHGERSPRETHLNKEKNKNSQTSTSKSVKNVTQPYLPLLHDCHKRQDLHRQNCWQIGRLRLLNIKIARRRRVTASAVSKAMSNELKLTQTTVIRRSSLSKTGKENEWWQMTEMDDVSVKDTKQIKSTDTVLWILIFTGFYNKILGSETIGRSYDF